MAAPTFNFLVAASAACHRSKRTFCREASRARSEALHLDLGVLGLGKKHASSDWPGMTFANFFAPRTRSSIRTMRGRFVAPAI